ncbi:MAG: acyl transferase [Ferruginibacter sp.]|nr:acyl transferase [Ferruginibacter sp.]
MNTSVKKSTLRDKIFTANDENFNSLAVEVFQFQYECNEVYRQYCDTLKIDAQKITSITQIPFLPIRFFKSHRIVTTEFEPARIFESSGTSQTINSRHYVKDISLYEESFTNAFRLFYGDPADWCILALLPSYLERSSSSLVMMAEKLVQQSGHPQGGFYLNELKKLQATLLDLEKKQQKTLLLGVTFALLDFAEQFPTQLHYTTIMETGGMKGRREELVREQVHEILCTSFQLKQVHSEYSMTELLSQAYSAGNGLFNCPPWMKILLRQEDDPLTIHITGSERAITGAVNIVDLANLYSCSFIAAEDAGTLYPNGSFEILGRLDNTDIRGCSLLTL